MAVSIYSKASGDGRTREKEVGMIESWVGMVVGVFALAIAATLIIGHYRREHLRARLLKRMDPHRCWDVMRRRH
jgi:hypothetical protein